MKKLFLMTLTFAALATTANAAIKSEFWSQPGSGKSTLEVGLSSTPLSITTITGFSISKSNVTSMPLGLKYTQGINEALSWNIGTDFGKDETTTSSSNTSETGLGNIKVGMLAGSSDWFYGVDASLSLSKKKVGTTTETGTRVTGGHTLTPFGGYHSANLGLGARVDYAYKMDRTTQSGASETVYSGNSILSVTPYWETEYSSGLFGISLAYSQVASGKSKTGASESDIRSYTMMGFGAYLAHDISSNGTIVGNIAYISVPEYDYSATTKLSAAGTGFSVSYRMGF